jgi:hypothetical protein
MHLATTKRYGGSCFVTRETNILKRRPVLEAQFGLQPMTPERALAFVLRMKWRHEFREAHTMGDRSAN